MQNDRKSKLALMAASALIAASAALTPAHAGEFDQVAFPTTIEAVTQPTIVATDAYHDGNKDAFGLRLGIIAVTGGVIVGFIRLLGIRRVRNAVLRSAKSATKFGAATIGNAARSAARIFRSPLRVACWTCGIALLAFTGIGMYDVEWILGLAAGGALTGYAAVTSVKTRFQAARVNSNRG